MHLWRRTLFLIAIVAGGVLALMSLAGGNETFSEPWLKRMASGAGFIADIGVPAFLFGMVFFRKRRDWFCFLLSAVFWVACSAYTVKQSATWMAHTFETDQKPVEQAEKLAAKAGETTKTDLETERTNLREANDLALKGTTQAIRDNAAKQAKEARERIKKLEQESLSTVAPPQTETVPAKSAFAGHELLVTLILWALSQGCWHMAFAAGEGEAEIEVEPETRSRSKSPSPDAPPRKPRTASKPKVQSSGIVINMEDRAKVVRSDRFSGMSEQQIANVLGWSKSMVHRARIYANKPVQGAPVHAAA